MDVLVVVLLMIIAGFFGWSIRDAQADREREAEHGGKDEERG